MPFEFSVEATHPPPPIGEGQGTVQVTGILQGRVAPVTWCGVRACARTLSSHPSSNTDGIEEKRM